jgi:hypothetical protein
VTIYDSSGAAFTSPTLWAVIWKSHTEPRVRSYLWTVGFQPSAEEALSKAEAEAEEERSRPNVRTPDLQPDLLRPMPELGYQQEAWSAIWKSHTEPRIRPFLYLIEPSPECILDRVKYRFLSERGLRSRRALCNGTFYPVRLDLAHVASLGTFYPVLVSMAMEVYEDPTKTRVFEGSTERMDVV